jgi:hypothetical protein
MWWAALVGGLIEVAGTLVGRVLLSLGIGYVTYTGFDSSMSAVKSMISGYLHGLPSLMLQAAGSLKLGSSISIVLSGLAVRMVMSGLVSGAMRKMVVKG